MTRAEEHAEKVRASAFGLDNDANDALSELVADAEALAEAVDDFLHGGDGEEELGEALARHRGEK